MKRLLTDLVFVTFLGISQFVFGINYVYVIDLNDNQINVLDIDDNYTAITGSPFSTGGTGARYGAVSPDGSRIYIANETSMTVSVLDAVTLSPISGSPFGGFANPNFIVINSTGDRVYVIEFNSMGGSAATIYLNDADMNLITSTTLAGVNANTFSAALSADETVLYVIDIGQGEISRLNASTLTTIGSPVSTGGSVPTYVTLNPAGTRVYVVNNVSGNITYFNTDLTGATTVGAATTTVQIPQAMSFSSDGTKLYVSDSNNANVKVLDPDTLAPVESALPSQGVSPIVNTINPDGTLLYVTNVVSGGLAVIDLSTSMPISGSAFLSSSDDLYGILFSSFQESSGSTIRGVQLQNDFGVVFEYYNKISWSFADTTGIVGFYIYRDGVRIATLGSSESFYEDHNRPKGESFTYSVTSFDSSGTESTALVTTIY